jgi:hypothetical protein
MNTKVNKKDQINILKCTEKRAYKLHSGKVGIQRLTLIVKGVSKAKERQYRHVYGHDRCVFTTIKPRLDPSIERRCWTFRKFRIKRHERCEAGTGASRLVWYGKSISAYIYI